MAHGEYGKDKVSMQVLIKKQKAIELEIDGYSGEMRADSQRLLSKEHLRETGNSEHTAQIYLIHRTCLLCTLIHCG